MAEANGGNGPHSSTELAAAITLLAEALRPPAPKPGSSKLPEFFREVAKTLLPSIVMFGLGYVFIQGVQFDLQREQFTAATADKLKEYVKTLTTAGAETTKADLEATALALGGFGGVAAFPLIGIIQLGGEQRVSAAKSGLKQAGRIAPAATCDALATVIDDATDAYDWRTIKALTEVAGLVGCAEARRPIENLPEKIESWATRPPPMTNEAKAEFQATADTALARIQAAARRKSSWW